MLRVATLVVVASSVASAGPRLEQMAAARSSSSLRLRLSKQSAPGNTILVALVTGTGSCTISDSAGNSYLRTIPVVGAGPLNTRVGSIAFATDIAIDAAPLELVFNCQTPEVRVCEYSGLARTQLLDGFVNATSATTTTLDSGVLTTVASDALLFGWLYSRSSVGAVAPGWVVRSRFDNDALADRVVTSAGDYSITAGSTDTTWLAVLAAFKVDLSLDAGALGPAVDGGPGRGFRYVQGTAASATALTVQLPEPSQNGDTFVLSTSGNCTPTDSSAHVYARAVGPTSGSGGVAGIDQSVWYARVTNAGPDPLSFASACGETLVVTEYAGIAAFDSSIAATSTASTLVSTGPFVTLAANALVLSFIRSSNLVASPGPGAMFRIPFDGDQMMDFVAGPAGQYPQTATSTSTDWIISTVSFAPLDGGVAMGVDAGMPDAGLPDAGSADAGTVPTDDAGVRDGGPDAVEPLPLSVNCGCGTDARVLLGLALVTLLRARRASPG